MSMPEFPDMTPIRREDAINAVLVSIAMEELSMSHILNAEGEKIQYILGTLDGSDPGTVTIKDVLEINESVNDTLRNVVRNQMMLQFKLEDVMKLEEITKL